MADFILFNHGADYINDHGISGTCKFALSTKNAEELKATDTTSTSGEITGTGYTRKEQSAPASASQKKSFAQMSWETGTATDWPASVKSCVLIINNGSEDIALCAWNLQAGGAARNLSAANTTERFTPTWQLS